MLNYDRYIANPTFNCNVFVYWLSLLCSLVYTVYRDRREGEGIGRLEAARNYRGPAVRNGARGPIMLHMFLSFSVMSTVIR